MLGALLATTFAATLDLSHLPSDAELAALVWEHAAELQLARARVAAARGEHERALLLPNPSIDLSASTLPFGPQNPSAPVTQPALEVPSFAAGVSELIELGKRGPRQEAARKALDAAVWDAREQLRQRFFDLRDHLGEIAGAQARIAALTALVADAGRLAGIQKTRAEKGDASSLDADRALLDEEKLQSTLGAEQEHLVAELRACAEAAGVRCAAFGDDALAVGYLSTVSAAAGRVEDRPDLRALQALEDSSVAAELLASRHAIPDPTLRLGYVRDQYVASGNWPNSVFVGVSVPLPVFDHGQADARAAAATADAARRARAQAIETALEQQQRLKAQIASIEARRAQLRDHALPLARDVVARLDAAVVRGAAAVQDVLIARRTLVELLLDANDLDLSDFHSRVALSRFSGATVPTPPELQP